MIIRVFGQQEKRFDVLRPLRDVVKLDGIVCLPWGLWVGKHKPLTGPWCLEDAPSGWARLGFAYDDVVYTDIGEYAHIRALRWLYNGRLTVTPAPDCAVYLRQCVAEFWKPSAYQGATKYMVYPARWASLADEQTYSGYYVDTVFINAPGYSWDERNELLVCAKSLKKLMENCSRLWLSRELEHRLAELEAPPKDEVATDIPPDAVDSAV